MTTTKSEAKSYKNHKVGSRKSKVHQLFDKQGADAAWTLGVKLKLKENTLRSWFGAWQREGKGKAKPATKPTTKKTPTKKKADQANVEVAIS